MRAPLSSRATGALARRRPRPPRRSRAADDDGAALAVAADKPRAELHSVARAMGLSTCQGTCPRREGTAASLLRRLASFRA